MSWVVNEWKDGLPHRALKKIEEMEVQLDRLKKERQQKQFQLESIEQTLEKQKRKTEEEKSALAELKRDNQSLAESCEHLEQKRQKFEHEVQTREGRISCLDGQLQHTKKALDDETNKTLQLKAEMEKLQHDHLETVRKMEHLQGEYQKLQEHTNHTKRQLEGTTDKLRDSQNEVRHLQGQLDGQTGGRTNRHFSGGNNELSTLRQKLSDLEALRKKDAEEKQNMETELKSLQEKVSKDFGNTSEKLEALEQEKKRLQSNLENQHLALSSSQQATQRNFVEQQGITEVQMEKLEQLVERLKKEIEGLKTKSANLEICLQAKDKSILDEKAQMRSVQADLDFANSTLIEKDKKVSQLQEENGKTRSQLEEANQKISLLEEKLKKLGQELECQRHNADAARLAQEQRIKDREREQKAEAAQQGDMMKDMERQLNEARNKLAQEQNKAQQEQNHLQGQLERSNQKCHTLERELKEVQQKLQTAEHTVNSHDVTVAKFQATVDDANKEKDRLSVLLDQKSGEIALLEEKQKQLKIDLDRADQINSDIRGNMLDKELEVESLEAKLERQSAEQMKTVNEMTKLKSQCDDLQKSEACMNEKVQNLYKENEGLHEDYKKACSLADEKAKEVRDLVDQLSDKETDVTKLHQRLASNEDTLKQLKETHNSLQGSYSELEENMQQKCEEFTMVSDDLSRLQQESNHKTKNLEDALKEAHEKLSRQASEMKEKESELNQITAELTSMQDNYKELDAQAELLKDHQEQTNTLVKNKQESISNLHEEIDSLKGELNQLQQQLKSSQEEICILQKDHQELTGLNSSLSDGKEQLLGQIQLKEGELTEVNMKCEQMSFKIDNLERDIAVKQQAIDESKEHSLKLENILEQLKAEKGVQEENSSKALQDLQVQIEYKQNIVEMKMKEIEALTSDLGELRNLHAGLKEQNSVQIEENKLLQTQIDKLQVEFEDLQTELTEKSSKVEKSRQHIHELENSLKDAREDKSVQEDKYCKSLHNLQVEIDCKEDLLDSKTSDYEEMSTKLTNAEKEREKFELMSSTLQAEKEQLQESMEQKDLHLNNLTLKVDELSNELKGNKDTSATFIKELENKVATMQTKESQLMLEINQVGEALENTKAEVNQCNKLIEELKMKNSQISEQSQQTAQKYGQFNAALEASEEEKSKLNGQILVKQEELKDAQNKLAVMKDKTDGLLADASNHVKQLEADKVLLKTDLDEAALKLENFQETSESTVKQIDELTHTKTQLVQQIEKQDSCIQQLEVECNEIKKVKEILEGKCEQLENQLQEVSQNLKTTEISSTDVVQGLQVKLEAMEETRKGQIAEHEQLVQQLDSKHAELEKTVEELEKEQEKNMQVGQQCTEYKERIDKLQARMDESESANVNLAEEAESLRKKVSEMEVSCSTIQVKSEGIASEFKVKLENLEKENEDLRKQIEDVTANLENEQEKALALMSQLSQMEEKKSQYEQEISQQQETIAKLKGSISEQEAFKANLCQTLDEAKCELNDAKHISADSKMKSESLVLDMTMKQENLEKEKAALKCVIEEGCLKIQNLSEDLESAKHSLKESSEKNNQLQHIVESLKEENESLKAEQEKMMSEKNIAMQTCETLNSKEIERQEFEEQLKVERQNMVCQVQQLQQQEKQLQQSLVETRDEIKKLEESVFKLAEENVELKSLRDSQDADMETTLKRLNKLKEVSNEQASKICEYEATVKGQEEKIESLTKELEEAEDVLTSSQKGHMGSLHEKDQELKRVQEEMECLHEEIKFKASELSDTQDALALKEQDIDTFKTAIEDRMSDLDQEKEGLIQQLADAHSMLDKAKQQNSTLQGTIDQYDVEKEVLVNFNAKMEGEIENMRKSAHEQVSKLKEDMAQVESKLQKKNEENGNLELQLCELKQESTRLQKQQAQSDSLHIDETQTQQEKICALEKSLIKTKNQLDDTEFNLRASEEKLLDVQNSMGAELETAKFRCKELAEKLQECENLNENKRAEMSTTHEFSLQAVKDAQATLESELNDLKTIFSETKDTHADESRRLNTDITALKMEADVLKNMKEDQERKIDELNSRLEDSTSQLQVKEEELRKALNDQAMLREDFKVKVADIETRDFSLSVTKESHQGLEKELIELKAELNSCKDTSMHKSVELCNEIAALKLEVDGLKNVKDEQEKQIAQTQGQLNNVREELAKTEELLVQANDSVKLQAEEIKQQILTIETLQFSLKVAKETENSLEKEVKDLKSDIIKAKDATSVTSGELEMKVTALMQEVEELRNVRDGQEAEIKTFHDQVMEMNSAITEKEQQLISVKNSEKGVDLELKAKISVIENHEFALNVAKDAQLALETEVNDLKNELNITKDNLIEITEKKSTDMALKKLEIDELKNIKTSFENKIEELEKQLEHSNSECLSKNQELIMACDAKKKAEQELKSKTVAVEMQEQSSNLKNEEFVQVLEKLENQLEEIKINKAILEKTLGEKNNQIQELNHKVSSLEASISTLEDEKSQKDIAMQKNETAREVKTQNHKSLVEKLQSEIGDVRSDLQMKCEHIDELEMKLHSTKIALSSAETGLLQKESDFQKECKRFQDIIDNNTNDIETKQQEIVKLSAQVQDLLSGTSLKETEYHSELHMSKSKIIELQGQLESSSKIHDKMVKDLEEEHQFALTSLKEEKDKIEEELNHMKTKAVALIDQQALAKSGIDTDVADLRNQLESKNNTLQLYKDEVEDLKMRIDNVTEERKYLADKLTALQEEHKGQNDAIQLGNQEFQEARHELEHKITCLKSQTNQLEGKIEENEVIISKLNSDKAEIMIKMDTMKSKIETLEDNIEAEVFRNEKLKSDIQILEDEKQNLSMELAKSKASVSALEQDKRDLSYQISCSNDDLAATQSYSQNLQSQIEHEDDQARSTTSRLAALEAEKIDMDFKIQFLQKKLDELECEKVVLVEDAEVKAKSSEMLKDCVDDLKIQLERSEQELKSAKENYTDLLTEKSQLEESTDERRSDHQSVCAELDKSKTQLDEFVQKYHELNKERDGLKAENESLQHSNDDLKSQLDGKDNAICLLEEDKEELMEKVKLNEADIVSYREKIYDLEKQIEEIKDLHRKLQDEFEDKDAAYNMVKMECEEGRVLLAEAQSSQTKSASDVKKLEAAICQLKEERDRQEQLLQTEQQTNNHLSDSLSTAEAAVNEFKESLVIMEKSITKLGDQRRKEEQKRVEAEELLQVVQSEAQGLEAEITSLEAEVKQQKTEIDQLKHLNGNLDASLAEVKEKLMEKELEVSVLTNEQADNDKVLVNLAKEIDELKDKENALQCQVTKQEHLVQESEERHNKEMEVCQQEKGEIVNQLEELRVELGQVHEKYITSCSQLNNMEGSQQGLQSELSGLQTELATIEGEKSDLNSQVQHLKREVELGNQDSNELKAKLQLTEDKASTLTELSEDLQTKVTNLEASLVQLEKEVQDKSIAIQKKEQEIEGKEKGNRDLLDEYLKLEEVKAKLSLELEDSNRQNLIISKQIETFKQELQLNQSKLADTVLERDNTRSQVEEFQELQASHQAELASLQSDNNKLEEEVKELQMQHKQAADQLCQQLQQTQNLLKSAEERQEDTCMELENLRIKLQEAVDEQNSSDKLSRNLKLQLGTLQENYTRDAKNYEVQLTNMEKEQQEALTSMAIKHSTEVENLQEKINYLRESESSLKTSCETVKAQLTNLEREIESKTLRKQEPSAADKEEIEVLMGRIKLLNNNARQQDRQLQESQKHVGALELELQQMKSKLETAETALESLKNEVEENGSTSGAGESSKQGKCQGECINKMYQLVSQMKPLKEENEKLKSRREFNKNKIKLLEDQNKALEKKLEQLQKQPSSATKNTPVTTAKNTTSSSAHKPTSLSGKLTRSCSASRAVSSAEKVNERKSASHSKTKVPPCSADKPPLSRLSRQQSFSSKKTESAADNAFTTVKSSAAKNLDFGTGKTLTVPVVKLSEPLIKKSGSNSSLTTGAKITQISGATKHLSTNPKTVVQEGKSLIPSKRQSSEVTQSHSKRLCMKPTPKMGRYGASPARGSRLLARVGGITESGTDQRIRTRSMSAEISLSQLPTATEVRNQHKDARDPGALENITNSPKKIRPVGPIRSLSLAKSPEERAKRAARRQHTKHPQEPSQTAAGQDDKPQDCKVS